MILHNLDKFRAGLPVSKEVLQRLDATRLGHQAITQHLGGRNIYVRLTIVPILFDQLSSTLSVFFPRMSSAKVLPGGLDK